MHSRPQIHVQVVSL